MGALHRGLKVSPYFIGWLTPQNGLTIRLTNLVDLFCKLIGLDYRPTTWASSLHMATIWFLNANSKNPILKSFLEMI